MIITVRQGEEGDAEILADLNSFVQELHVTHVPHRFKPSETVAVADWYRKMLQNPDCRAWIAEAEGLPAGYALTFTYDRPENPFCFRRVYCEIDQIGVSPKFRRKGVARALIECILSETHSVGIRDLELNSWSFNTEAHDTFRALGFHPQIVRFSRTEL